MSEKFAFAEHEAGRSKLEVLALRMAKYRRQRIDASRFLNGPWKNIDPAKRTDSQIEDAQKKLIIARIEWRKASTALWRLVEKMERGEA